MFLFCIQVKNKSYTLPHCEEVSPGQTPRVRPSSDPTSGAREGLTSGVWPGLTDCNVVNFLSHECIHKCIKSHDLSLSIYRPMSCLSIL